MSHYEDEDVVDYCCVIGVNKMSSVFGLQVQLYAIIPVKFRSKKKIEIKEWNCAIAICQDSVLIDVTLNVSLLFSLSFGPLYEYASSSKFFNSDSSKSKFCQQKKKKNEKPLMCWYAWRTNSIFDIELDNWFKIVHSNINSFAYNRFMSKYFIFQIFSLGRENPKNKCEIFEI